MVEAVLESAVKMGVDLVLIQEPRGEKEKDGTTSHPSFRFIKGAEGEPTKCWIAVNRASQWRVTELKHLTRKCENHVQVVEVSAPGQNMVLVANVYNRHRGGEGNCPAQKALWGEIAKAERVVIAGDMNAHSKLWNDRTTGARNNVF